MTLTKTKKKIASIFIGLSLLGGGAAIPLVPTEYLCSVAGNETEFSTNDGYLHQGEWAPAEKGFKWVNEGFGVRKEKDSYDTNKLTERSVVGLRYWRQCDENGSKKIDHFTKVEYESLKEASGIKKTELKGLGSMLIDRAEAAIAFEATSTGRNSTGNSITISHTCTNSNSYMAVQTSVQDSNHANFPVTAVTYNAASLSKVRSDEAAGNNRTEIWYFVPTTNCNGAAHNVVVTVTGSLGELAAIVSTYTGVDQSTPNDANNGSSGNSSTASVSVTTVKDNSWLLTMSSSEANFTGNGTGQTTLYTLTDQSFENARGSYEGPKTPAGADTQSFTLGFGTSWAISSVSIMPVQGGGSAASGDSYSFITE